MPLIPNAGAVALTGHFSVDPTADLHERSWKGSDERYRVRVPGAVDDGPRTPRAARITAATAAPPSSRDCSTVAGAPSRSMSASLTSSLDRKAMPNSAARPRASVDFPAAGQPPTSTNAFTGHSLPRRLRTTDAASCPRERGAGQPPAIAPTTKNGSSPCTTRSGSGASGSSWDRSSEHA